MNALIYHVASGQAFFSGVATIFLAAISASFPAGRWAAVVRTCAACVGLILIVVSSTPLPGGFDLGAGALTLAWIGVEGSSRAAWRRARLPLRLVVTAAWGLGAAWELPFHGMPTVPEMGNPTIYVVGDSLGAGIGGEAATWPVLLERRHGVTVRDLSRAGATVASARSQADLVDEPGTLVLAEIGGNDVLGSTSPADFSRGLDGLLARLCAEGRTVVMLELPLPPFCGEYGAIQRRLARSHGVGLVPKRVLIGVLTTRGATTDTLHLSATGHELMAGAVWNVLRPAFAAAGGPARIDRHPGGPR